MSELERKEKDSLVVVWTSGDKEVALNMVFMYALNAKKNDWWKDIKVIVWGPSANLLSKDIKLQDHVKEMIRLGIDVEACKVCTDRYGVSTSLEELGVAVKYIGEPFTHYIKSERTVITF